MTFYESIFDTPKFVSYESRVSFSIWPHYKRGFQFHYLRMYVRILPWVCSRSSYKRGPCYNVIYIFTWTYLNNNFSQISTNKSTWKILGFWLWNDVSVSSLLTTYYFKYCEINNITWEKQVADGIVGTLLWPNKIRFLYCLLF